ncbi:alanine/glycine:cation symporter family protein [Campylobacter pinnipediorum]|uniref:alanine/glycine:cation symporter family protein n=1 Tax=Campylobacter pinnipediorum TaxID=1965231 RepID=UPI00084DE4A7|nr:alanine/glycine:cation symporter family protein [Campylobacter pinnipediorum]AQW83570.1 Na+/alanine symporter family protein [Campylobacter pinnipediorum subsp. pinnipediorum]
MSELSNNLLTILTQIVNTLNNYLWSSLVYILLAVGIYFTIRTRFLQIRLFKQSIRRMVVGKRVSAHAISPFQAFATGLASRVGTGNVAGVAIAISLGGAGAVFWMWITALIGMSSAFVESSLAQLYKIKNPDGRGYRGGPAYYITQGLGMRWLGVAFAVSLILAFGFVFNSVQANTITAVTSKAWDWNIEYVAVGLVILTAPIIFGGIKRVAKVAEKIVPVMALAYLLIAVYIIITNLGEVPVVFGKIFKDAFNFSAAGGGVVGGLTAAMLNGIKRGLFSNEAGMGSAPNAAAASDAWHPANQGLIQMLGVFVDTIVVCSCTAFIILLSGAIGTEGIDGAQITQLAIQHSVGDWGGSFLAILLFFFCFSSIIGNYAYAESNMQFIKNSPITLTIFRIIVLFMVYFGSVQKVGLVWDMADASMAIMAVINLIVIVIMAPTAMLLLKDFEEQVKEHHSPEFDISKYPELHKKVGSDVWVKGKTEHGF